MKLLENKYLTPIVVLAICVAGLLLTSCATVKVRVPLGEEEKFGAIDFGMTYYPPRDFEQKLYDAPATLPDWIKLKVSRDFKSFKEEAKK